MAKVVSLRKTCHATGAPRYIGTLSAYNDVAIVYSPSVRSALNAAMRISLDAPQGLRAPRKQPYHVPTRASSLASGNLDAGERSRAHRGHVQSPRRCCGEACAARRGGRVRDTPGTAPDSKRHRWNDHRLSGIRHNSRPVAKRCVGHNQNTIRTQLGHNPGHNIGHNLISCNFAASGMHVNKFYVYIYSCSNAQLLQNCRDSDCVLYCVLDCVLIVS